MMLAALTDGPASAQSPSAPSVTFAGKTIRIVPGFSPGGLFDGFSRLLAKYLPQHLPGKPVVIVENMPGAGSMKAANYLARSAPKDGTVIGNFSQEMLVNQLIGAGGVDFDMQRFVWLGAMGSSTNICFVRDTAGVKTFAETLPPVSKRVAMGTSILFEYADVLRKVLGANMRVVSGYPGNAEVRLAVEKGEVDGMCASIEASRPTLQRWAEAGDPKVIVLVQFSHKGAAPKPDLAGVPQVWEFTRSAEEARLIRMLTAGEEFYVPYALAPGTPMEIAQAMRKAVWGALQDPGLRADATKAKWALDPVSPQRIESVIREVLETPEADKARFKAMLKQK
jgi:tripartite-type tricarboxylate transporter receptor subunit TctC